MVLITNKTVFSTSERTVYLIITAAETSDIIQQDTIYVYFMYQNIRVKNDNLFKMLSRTCIVFCSVSWSESPVIANCFTSTTPKYLGRTHARTHARTGMHIYTKKVRGTRYHNSLLLGVLFNTTDVFMAEATCMLLLKTAKRWCHKSLFT
jgi:hypothetical protein